MKPQSSPVIAEGRNGLATVVAVKQIGEEVFRGVFEVRSGKQNRVLALLSLIIKT